MGTGFSKIRQSQRKIFALRINKPEARLSGYQLENRICCDPEYRGINKTSSCPHANAEALAHETEADSEEELKTRIHLRTKTGQ